MGGVYFGGVGGGRWGWGNPHGNTSTNSSFPFEMVLDLLYDIIL